MNGMRRSIADFVCAFVIVAAVVLSIAVVTNESFFDNAVLWNGDQNTLVLFGSEFAVNERTVFVSQKLLEFNDVIFGRGFTLLMKTVAAEAGEYIRDLLTVVLTLARRVVGAE